MNGTKEEQNVNLARHEEQLKVVKAILDRYETNHFPTIEKRFRIIETRFDLIENKMAFWGGAIACLNFLIALLTIILKFFIH